MLSVLSSAEAPGGYPNKNSSNLMSFSLSPASLRLKEATVEERALKCSGLQRGVDNGLQQDRKLLQ